ncbi:hypothetical protein L249_2792 [Ophiocordyceps polyrhachis-furcata BCC 54312]|uniref:Uncharacterized protein n=1 Tax=Ophiocordyceps polyrhachis-furcata BCC 54312 TaxID=1330021 RepID=A0A367LTE8_9HYPO|nr:hypothetical protein L249_2792 [Ophiocordyceps polyrhachis-furcata BCC 54312]
MPSMLIASAFGTIIFSPLPRRRSNCPPGRRTGCPPGLRAVVPADDGTLAVASTASPRCAIAGGAALKTGCDWWRRANPPSPDRSGRSSRRVPGTWGKASLVCFFFLSNPVILGRFLVEFFIRGERRGCRDGPP